AHAHEVRVIRRQLADDIPLHIPVHDTLIDAGCRREHDDPQDRRYQPPLSVSSHGSPCCPAHDPSVSSPPLPTPLLPQAGAPAPVHGTPPPLRLIPPVRPRRPRWLRPRSLASFHRTRARAIHHTRTRAKI